MAFVEQLLIEFRIQRRRPFVWFCFIAFFAIAFGDTIQTGWQASGNEWVNGASMIVRRALIYSLLGVIAVAGIMTEPFVRDRQSQAQGLLLTTAASKWTFGFARFVVAYSFLLAATAMFIPGMILGSLVPGIASELIGPLVWQHYLKALFWIWLPNSLLIAAGVYLVSARFENRAISFATAIGAVALWITIRMVLGRDAYQQHLFQTASLLDPFGTFASSEFTLANTVDQNNRLFPPLQRLFLYNRLTWLIVSFVMIGVGTALVPLRPRLAKARKPKKTVDVGSPSRQSATLLASREKGKNGFRAAISGLLLMVRWELAMQWRQPASKICLLLVAISLWWSASSAVTHMFSLPSTDLLIHNTGFYFDKILVLAVVWVAGDLIWRDKLLGAEAMMETSPKSDAIHYLAKTITLLTIVCVFWLLAIFINVLYQVTHRYFQIEPSLYLVDSFVFKAPFYFAVAILAISIQAIVRQRMIAIAIVLVVYISEVLLVATGSQHPLFRFGRSSHFWYSLMDGYGHFWKSHLWMLLYWLLGCSAIWIVGLSSWWRGNYPQSRVTQLRRKLISVGGVSLFVCLCGFAATGFWIWNDSTANGNWPPIDEDRLKAEIEMKFGERWRNRPQPRIVEIEGELDLYPSTRSFRLKGKFVVENQSIEPISEVLLMTAPGLRLESVEFESGASMIDANEKLNVSVYRLEKPLEAGAKCWVAFETSSTPPRGLGIHLEADNVPEVSSVEVIGNGTCLLNLNLMPAIGYTDRVEHKPAWKRKKYGLPPEWKPPRGQTAENQGHNTLHLAWVDSMEMTIRTAPDQTALHAGVLEDSWTEPDGRRAFRYRMDRRCRGWSSIVTGRFNKQVFQQQGLPDVEVYFHPPHEANVEPFVKEFYRAMAHFADRYGPPPFKTFRLAECSLHYPGIGCRGGFGFCSEIRCWKTDLSGDGMEFLRRQAALLMAMTWWGDQVIPANVAGVKVIHAGLPHWSVELYLHQIRSAELNRRLGLQAMMDAFRKRGEMMDVEVPFLEEFKDSTMIRKKGSILILHLAEMVGFEKLERVLGEFLESNRFRNRPYPTPNEFVAHLEDKLPAGAGVFLNEMLKQKTVWKIVVADATCRLVSEPSQPEKWQLTATVEANQFHTTGLGKENEVSFNTSVELAAFSSFNVGLEGALLTTRKIGLQSGENKIEMELSGKPVCFAADPWLTLADPNPRDNVRRVRFEE